MTPNLGLLNNFIEIQNKNGKYIFDIAGATIGCHDIRQNALQ